MARIIKINREWWVYWTIPDWKLGKGRWRSGPYKWKWQAKIESWLLP